MRDGRLCCDMHESCAARVTHIDDKGFAYCTSHGERRKAHRPCRKLTPGEIATLERGETIAYRRPAISLRDWLLAARGYRPDFTGKVKATDDERLAWRAGKSPETYARPEAYVRDADESAPSSSPTGDAERLALVRERMSALDAALRVVLDAAEAAIDAHPGLTRATRSAPAFTAPPYTAEVSRCRLGYTVACQVYGDNKRTRTPTRITGFGETLADAIVAFEGGLDAWAAVLK